MSPHNYKHCATPNKPHAAWEMLYNTLQSTGSTHPDVLSRQWLWLRQHGSAIAPTSQKDQNLLLLSTSPFITKSSYLRTDAEAYLGKQLPQIAASLGINNLLAVILHAGVYALQTLYANTLLVVQEAALSTKACQDHIKTAAKNNKTIWIQLTLPQAPADIQFMALLKKLPRLDQGQRYELLWSFSQIQTATGATKFPLTVICGKKSLLWNHIPFLSHSGYTPDKASIDTMLIKLHRTFTKSPTLATIIPQHINLPTTQAKTPQTTIPSPIPLGTDLTPYQKLGQLWLSRFAEIQQKCRADLRDNPEITPLIRTLQASLTTAYADLRSTLLVDQYRAIRSMADSILVAETLCDTPPLTAEALPCFSQNKPNQVFITSYGMTTLAGALLAYRNAYPTAPPKVASMAHTYFETAGVIGIIQSIQPGFCIPHPGMENVTQMPTDTHILVIEPHPNNVTTKTPVISPSLETLATQIREVLQNRNTPLLVLMDITIGVISDPALNTFIETVSDLIDTQKLHVVMGQSLVKFSALGIDVASAGLVMVWSKSQAYTEQIHRFLSDAKVPDHVQAFYTHLLTAGLPLAEAYLDTIRDNTQYLSDQILGKLAEINLGEREVRVMDIHPNLDRGTCYIGIDLDAFRHQFQDNTRLEIITHKVADTLIQIANEEGLVLTNRSSFGFPFSNISVCGDAIRLTVGIESRDTLTQLADIITVVAVGLKWDTQDLSDPYIDKDSIDPSVSIDPGILDFINSNRKQLTPNLTVAKLDNLLHTLKNIAKDTKTGFSRELRNIDEICVGEYETEEGLDLDLEWQETGVSTLSWSPGQDFFEQKTKDTQTQKLTYLEIENGFRVTPSSRANLAITLLSIAQSNHLMEGYGLNAKLPPGMNHFARHAFGRTNNTYEIWAQTTYEALPTRRKITIADGTTFNQRLYPADKVLIYHNKAYWKQSELEGAALDTWKNSLNTGHHTCLIREKGSKLYLGLQPRTNTERWTIGNQTLSIHIAENAPIRVGDSTYTLSQLRTFQGPGSLSPITSYWELKKNLDTPSESRQHITQLITHLRQKQKDHLQNLLILVSESQQDMFQAFENTIQHVNT